MLEEIVVSLRDTLFERSNYCFQQDLAPAHKVKEEQQWLIQKVPDFVATNE